MGEMSRELGPFRIVRRLGVGGMAETFEVLRAGPGGFAQRSCLKRVLPAFEADMGFRASFLREAHLGATLRHSNIVGVLDYGEHAGAPYIAMELVEGVDLRSMLASVDGGRLPPPVVAWIGFEVARALEYAHAPDGEPAPAAVVHRDVSPSNVLLSRAGEVKLADFGVAKAMAGACATATEVVKGKIPYMAPEQMRGAALDGRADLFSLGVVLFEALSGERPFDGENDVETMGRIQAGQRRRLEALAPDTPGALVAIVDRLLEHDPDARFEDAGGLLAALAPLWPGPSVALEIAAWVEEHLGGPETRDHVLARLELERDTALGQALGTTGRGGTPDPTRYATALEEATTEKAGAATEVLPLRRSPARRGWRPARVAGSLAAVGAVGALVAMALRSPSASVGMPARTEADGAAPSTPASALPSPRASSAEGPAGLATRDAVADPRPTPSPSTVAASASPAGDDPELSEVDPGTLRVAVIPWGNVWVDDRFMGRAPATVSLRPGSHRVQAGFDAPSLQRRVTVQSGQRKRVELELADPSGAGH